MINISNNLWIHDGPTVPFMGLPYSTRMTIIRLADGKLWVHSPCKLTPAVAAQVDALGPVGYLVAPNKLHHLFLPMWQAHSPQAKSYAAPGLMAKRADIHFDTELKDSAEPQWQAEIQQTIFGGSPLMQEAVFFHASSRTLILTDLIENFPAVHFKPWQRPIAKITGILAPDGQTPLDWRLSFMFGKAEARRSLELIKGWRPQRIILAHGECVWQQAEGFLARSFRWL